MRKLRILSDMDGIITDLLTKWLDRYNKDYDDNLTTADIRHHEVSNAVKPEARLPKSNPAIYEYIKEDHFFADLEPLDGAIGTLKSLAADGHEVWIVTAPSDNKTSPGDKIEWCKEHLGLHRKDIFPVHHKHAIPGDVFIDDTPKKLRAYREAWPDAHILTMAYPYNEGVDDIVNLRAQGWENPKEAWRQIHEYINNLASE